MADTTYEIFPSTGFAVTLFLVSADIKKSLDFYSRILGGKVVMDGENGTPGIVQLENTWVVINVGGAPTDDKPNVYLAPPKDGGAVSGFMNICAVSSFPHFVKRLSHKTSLNSGNRRSLAPVTLLAPLAKNDVCIIVPQLTTLK
ncbi:VOC family protein [Tunturiibacter psychrotolerans]|uniref:VOC family protein n=1 Tax=Tunturiibacter psychrotolerans TaxID=3069686 RepID=UPI003D22001B